MKVTPSLTISTAAGWETADERSAALEALRSELDDLLTPQSRRDRKRRRCSSNPLPLEITSPAGLVVQIGRNHRQNEWISLRQARSGDLWFHAQECREAMWC